MCVCVCVYVCVRAFICHPFFFRPYMRRAQSRSVGIQGVFNLLWKKKRAYGGLGGGVLVGANCAQDGCRRVSMEMCVCFSLICHPIWMPIYEKKRDSSDLSHLGLTEGGRRARHDGRRRRRRDRQWDSVAFRACLALGAETL